MVSNSLCQALQSNHFLQQGLPVEACALRACLLGRRESEYCRERESETETDSHHAQVGSTGKLYPPKFSNTTNENTH